ncbi:thioredoxin-like [2Fe-2S] ferredoxin-domain-containing protein, partial [Jimgerdemannia flammicorona]
TPPLPPPENGFREVACTSRCTRRHSVSEPHRQANSPLLHRRLLRPLVRGTFNGSTRLVVCLSLQIHCSSHSTQHRDTPNNNSSIPFAFSPENRKRVDGIIAKYPTQYKKAAVIPLLDLGQRQHGFTSISVMNEVARILEMPPMRVYEVATFYTMFNRKPVGKYFLQVCTTTPCLLGGCGASVILETVKKHLGLEVGQTSEDGKFTLVEVECAAACVNAPVIAVNDDYYEDLTPETTIKLLDALKRDAPPKPGPMSGRLTCEPAGGFTTLLGEPPEPGFRVRTDL